MEKCLTFSPKRRIDVDEALQHPYLQASARFLWRATGVLTRAQSYHDAQDEPTSEPLDPSFFDFDYGTPLGKEELKGGSGSAPAHALLTGWAALIYEEITRPRGE